MGTSPGCTPFHSHERRKESDIFPAATVFPFAVANQRSFRAYTAVAVPRLECHYDSDGGSGGGDEEEGSDGDGGGAPSGEDAAGKGGEDSDDGQGSSSSSEEEEERQHAAGVKREEGGLRRLTAVQEVEPAEEDSHSSPPR